MRDYLTAAIHAASCGNTQLAVIELAIHLGAEGADAKRLWRELPGELHAILEGRPNLRRAVDARVEAASMMSARIARALEIVAEMRSGPNRYALNSRDLVSQAYGIVSVVAASSLECEGAWIGAANSVLSDDDERAAWPNVEESLVIDTFERAIFLLDGRKSPSDGVQPVADREAVLNAASLAF